MSIGTSRSDVERRETQLEAIRDLMLTAAFRGTWLTLGEIAEFTEYGEASISAQLRHLRKSRFGCYAVEKRRRRQRRVNGAAHHEGNPEMGLWEYRVIPPR